LVGAVGLMLDEHVVDDEQVSVGQVGADPL